MALSTAGDDDDGVRDRELRAGIGVGVTLIAAERDEVASRQAVLLPGSDEDYLA